MQAYIIRLLGMALLGLSMTVQAGISLPLKDGSTVDLYDKSYALLIGVSDYEYWPDLPGVENDITAVGKGLKKHGFKVISLLNPTRASFDTTMRDFIGDHGQDPENRLIVYYAGHGYTLTTNRGRELGYIVPSDTPLPKDGSGAFKKKAVSMLEIEIFAKQMESKHALFTFDSCFSGSLFEITRAVPDTISIKTSEPVRQFITAGSAEQTVPDKSVFRNQFVAGLEGDADVNKDGFITGTELAQYIEEKVTNYTRRAQTPQYGKIRDPYLDKGDFVFINPRMEIIINVPGKQNVKRAKPREVDPAAIELSYWDAIKGTNDSEVYQAYLDEYPTGQFSKLAKLLIKQVGKQEERTRTLKLESEEQQRQQAQQSAKREEEFKRQQELLAQQQRDNEQRMADFKKEQVALAEKREAEEGRLNELIEQQQALAKSRQQLAMVNSNIQPESITGKSISIAAITWPGNLMDDHHFERIMTNKKMSEYMLDTVSKSIDKVLKRSNNYIRLISKDEINSIVFEGDDYDESKRVCAEHKVDKVTIVKFTRSTHTGSAEVHLYDCASGDKEVALIDLSTTRGEVYHLETSLYKALRDFYTENLEILDLRN